MKIFFSAGEPSGDVHAAALIRKLREHAPGAQFVGFGGPEMEKAGCNLLADLTKHAIMWFASAIAQYFKFRKLLGEAKTYFKTEHIDAVVLVDYPGFNWHVAKAAKQLGIPVYYFVPPQVWAWAQWRIAKMRRYVDGILCPLDFEFRWFQERGCSTAYIGHPFFEEIRQKESDTTFLENFYAKYGDGPILTLLPGSRNQEVKANLDDMLLTVDCVRSMVPNVQPVFAAFNEIHAEYIQDRVKELGLSIPIFVGRTAELIRAAECCMAVSGSVSLDLLACNKPTVVYYRIGSFPLLVQRFFRRTRYITLVNLLGLDSRRDPNLPGSPIFFDNSVRLIPAEPSLEDRNLMFFPEFLTSKDRSKDAAAYLIYWLSNPSNLADLKRHLAALLEHVDRISSPLDRAARCLLNGIREKEMERTQIIIPT